MSVVVLWDIDQTLVRTGGAGSAGMDLAFEEIYGVRDAFGRVEFSGRTDYAIFRDALYFNEISNEAFEEQLERFRAVYLRHLAVLLPEKEGVVLPGIVDLISALQMETAQGVATGNFEGGARLKLTHFALDTWLRHGAYGDRFAARSELVAEAAREVREAHGLSNGRVVVIGDTPLDIEGARANGFASLAVATGRHGAAELEHAGADLAVTDLAETGELVRFITRDA
jgi:phosphoglycolate phosphatase-like HAD superfamily hydrolase